MAAPSGITWGDIVGGYGRIGIYVGLTNTNTQTKVNVQVWFWSKYSVSDTSNSYYYNNNATSATTKIGSKSISTTVDTGSGWSTSNQKKLGEANYTYDRGTSAKTISCAAKLSGVDRVGGTMTHKQSYTIPALYKYTIYYHENGGTGGPADQTKYYGKALTLSTTKPTRPGYTFLGWSTNSSATSATWAAGGSYTTNASATLYAVWQENYLTVNYYSNYATSYNGTNTPKNTVNNNNVLVYSVNYYYDNEYTSGLLNYNSGSTIGMLRTGYTGTSEWGTSTSGGTLIHADKAFASGQALAEAFGKTLKTGNASVNVYAQWTINKYSVKYNANGGSGAPAEQQKTHGTALTLSTTKPTKAGHNFLGWGLSASDTSVDYDPGESYTENEPIVLFAIWSPYEHTVAYHANGGSGEPKSQTKTYGKALTLNKTIPTRTGYTFIEWNTDKYGSGKSYDAGQSYEREQNGGTVTLYAQWRINSYKLTINPNGGTWSGSTDTQSFNADYNTKKAIPVPVWEGHTFSGWTLDGYGTLSSLGAVSTTYTYKEGNGTLTAKWDTNDYAVVFDAGTNEGLMPSGMESEMVSIEYGTAIGTLPVAERKNYSFLGWFTAPTGGTQITSSYVITDNITFYAQYEIDASAYVNDEGTWRAGVVFAKDEENEMKKGHIKVNDNGTWKDAYCK